MTEDRSLIEEFISRRINPGARAVAICQRPTGTQGYSGATLRYYDVTYEHSGVVEQIMVVTKPAQRTERRTLAWLDSRKLPVPRNHTRELTADGAAPVAMEYAGDWPPGRGMAKLAAQALAAIHSAALGRANELLWLPPADPAFFAEAIVDRCWRGSWQHALRGTAYIDWYGRQRESQTSGDPFWTQFAEFDALTLIHADFHSDNVRTANDQVSIIDWEQARYGPLYIDLPNYFTRQEALLYRDALAELGCDIAPEHFLARFDAASRYVGFKYFGIGVLHWHEGNPPRRREDALYWISMALHGASGGRPIV
jgi:aminoglycoside phosphotransferase (APT) family kinase protein